jgi:hypothetical protein
MEPASVRRVTVAAARLRGWLAGFEQRHGSLSARLDGDRVAVVGEDGSRAWIEVPFPPLSATPGSVPERLLTHVERGRRVGVLLVRRGGYAAGIFDGAALLSSKVGSSYVQGTTKAGGWSQQRYARRRANQAEAAFAEAADVAARILLPGRATLDAVVRGGDRAAVESVLGDRRLAPLLPLVCGPLLEVADPRLRVLQATSAQFLAVRIALYP